MWPEQGGLRKQRLRANRALPPPLANIPRHEAAWAAAGPALKTVRLTRVRGQAPLKNFFLILVIEFVVLEGVVTWCRSSFSLIMFLWIFRFSLSLRWRLWIGSMNNEIIIIAGFTISFSHFHTFSRKHIFSAMIMDNSSHYSRTIDKTTNHEFKINSGNKNFRCVLGIDTKYKKVLRHRLIFKLYLWA